MGGFDTAKAHARGRTADAAVGDAQSMPRQDGWEEPVPFDEGPLPPFPCETLPPTLRQFVETMAEASQTPADMSAMAVMAVCATVLQKRAIVVVKEDYSEPLNIYVAAMADSGDRKSQIMRAATAPLDAIQRAEEERMRPVHAIAQAHFEIRSDRLKRAKAMAVKAKCEERERAELEVEHLAEDLLRFVVPPMPKLFAGDVTPEKLTSLIAEHGRIAILTAEPIVFSNIGRYSKHPILEVYLNAHAGDRINVDRIGRPSESIYDPALTVAQMIQPEIFQQLSEKPELRSSGLLARFLYAMPKTRVGNRVFNAESLPATVRARYAALVHALYKMPAEKEPRRLEMTPGAFAAWCNFGQQLEPQLAEFERLHPIRSWTSKLTGAVCRAMSPSLLKLT
jgi:hypothetical protein